MNQAYHGDTFGAVSVGAIPLYHDTFRPMLFSSYTIPYPYAYHHAGGETQAMDETLRSFLYRQPAWLCRCFGKLKAV